MMLKKKSIFKCKVVMGNTLVPTMFFLPAALLLHHFYIYSKQEFKVHTLHKGLKPNSISTPRSN